MNITDQNDPKLESISAKLYAHEFHSGIMKNNCGKYSKTKADSAREMIKNDLTNYRQHLENAQIADEDEETDDIRLLKLKGRAIECML